jgi:hypothetical protein
MLKVALRVPGAEGVKVTEIVQLFFAETLEPQVLVCAKSAALVPVNEIPVILKFTVVGLVSVTV